MTETFYFIEGSFSFILLLIQTVKCSALIRASYVLGLKRKRK